jgi:N,N'-diacetyllegionaminate synthase
MPDASSILIRSRHIGPGHPPYIIAEIGVNHDGSVDRALELVRAADEAKADAIKLQLFSTDLLMSKTAKLAAYQKSAGETDPISMLRRLELSAAQMQPILELAHELGLHAILTVFSVELVAEAEKVRSFLGSWDAYKTASPDIINRPLLDALAATGKPLIVSTGAATLEEVQRAARWLAPAHEQHRLALLQCVSSYPTPMDKASLGGIGAIADIFRGPVGYSDHTPEIITGSAAVCAGACILEKHLTYSRAAKGPDHAASLTPKDLADYVTGARVAHSGMSRAQRDALAARFGAADRVKRVLDIERDVRTVSRQSLTTARALAADHVLTSSDLTIKRPGTGIEPFRVSEVVGRRTIRAIEADFPLAESDLAADGRG